MLDHISSWSQTNQANSLESVSFGNFPLWLTCDLTRFTHSKQIVQGKKLLMDISSSSGKLILVKFRTTSKLQWAKEPLHLSGIITFHCSPEIIQAELKTLTFRTFTNENVLPIQSHLRSKGKSSAYKVLTFIFFVCRTETGTSGPHVFMLREADML